jgi:hypothetical protein
MTKCRRVSGFGLRDPRKARRDDGDVRELLEADAGRDRALSTSVGSKVISCPLFL